MKKNNKGLAALIIGSSVTLALLLAGCAPSAPADTQTASANAAALLNQNSSTTDTNTSWEPSPENCSLIQDEFALAEVPIRSAAKIDRYEQCQAAMLGVLNADGTTTTVISVDADTPLTSANTTADPRTPATFKDVAEICGRVLTWKALRDCVLDQDDIQWYIDAINTRADELKFTWADVNKWADDPEINKIDDTQVLIQVYGEGYTLDEIERLAAEIVGPSTAAKLVRENKIAYHPEGFMNTYAVDKEVSDFFDARTMVRVSLAPVVYNVKGEFLELNPDSGIFLDCGNLWWIPKGVWKCTDSSCTPPPCPPGNLNPDCAPKSDDANVGYWFPEGTVTNLGSGTLTGTIIVETQTGDGGGGVQTGSGDGAGAETGTGAEGAGSVGTEERDVNTNEGGTGNGTDTGGF